jgi:hypothetical protein
MLRNLLDKVHSRLAAPAAPPQVEIFIATKDSAGWIETLLDAYRRYGIQAVVLLDGSSRDATEQILKRRRIRYAKVYPEFPRVEAVIKEIPSRCQAEWALRLDDDEFLSRGLLTWMNNNLADASAPIVGIPRRWVRLGEIGRCEYSNHKILRWLDDKMDIQWRLFRPNEVEYVSDIHSAGFLVPNHQLAPDDAFIVHLDWVLRSFAQRAKKVAGYDQQKANAGSGFREIYLWETADIAEHAFARMETDEFDQLAKHLWRRAPVETDRKA